MRKNRRFQSRRATQDYVREFGGREDDGDLHDRTAGRLTRISSVQKKKLTERPQSFVRITRT